MKIRESVLALKDELIKIRRDLHRIPEPGFKEYRTLKYIYDYLEALSPDVLLINKGIKAVFNGRGEKAIGFRADIDALPLNERTGLEFTSLNEGFMHACGHDGHTAILLLFARMIAGVRDQLKNTIVIIFQPNEEEGLGADELIRLGFLEEPHIDELYGLHIWPEFNEHDIVLSSGALMSGMHNFSVTFTGKSVHGTLPHMGRDPIVAAASFIMSSQTVVSRNSSPFEPVVFTVGSIHGGSAANVVAESVRIECTLRSFTEKSLSFARKMLYEHAYSSGRAFDVEVLIETLADSIPVVNDRELALKAMDMFDKKEKEHIITSACVMPSEDFACYQRKTKTMFFLLGSKNETCCHMLHSDTYLLNEDVLPDGVELFLRIAES